MQWLVITAPNLNGAVDNSGIRRTVAACWVPRLRGTPR